MVMLAKIRRMHLRDGLPPPDAREQAMDEGFTRQVLALRERLRSDYALGGDEATLAAR